MARNKSIDNQNVVLKLTDIVFDKEIYPRNNLFWQTAYQYSEEMKSGAVFPQVVVAEEKGSYYLVDGKNRIEALKLLGVTETKCTVLTGLTRMQMFEEAIKRNVSHGQALSPYDKRMVALKLKNMRYPLNRICELIQVPLDNIENFISQRLVNSITGDTINESIIVKSGLKHLAGTNISAAEMGTIIINQDGISIGSQVSLLDQFIRLLENNLIDIKNGEIKKRLKTIKKLI